MNKNLYEKYRDDEQKIQFVAHSIGKSARDDKTPVLPWFGPELSKDVHPSEILPEQHGYFLVSSEWMAQWREFVNNRNSRPGPISNLRLKKKICR